MQALTFGKHRGKPLRTVPHDYLEWVLQTVPVSHSTKRDIRAILGGAKSVTTYEPKNYDAIYGPGPVGDIESRLTEADIPY